MTALFSDQRQSSLLDSPLQKMSGATNLFMVWTWPEKCASSFGRNKRNEMKTALRKQLDGLWIAAKMVYCPACDEEWVETNKQFFHYKCTILHCISNKADNTK